MKNKILTLKKPEECETSLLRTLTRLVLLSCSVSLLWLSAVVMRMLRPKLASVMQALRTTLLVYLHSLLRLFQNKRHLVGFVLLVVSAVSIFAHQFLLDPYVQDHKVCSIIGFKSACWNLETRTGWCYISWFYYWETIRFSVAAIFGAVGMILFVPAKYSLSFIPFSILQAFGWIGLFHFTFFTNSHETYHAWPAWDIILLGFTLGFGVVRCSDYLMYWWNHKKMGNHARFVGVAEMKLSPEEKAMLSEGLAKEYRTIQKMI